MDSLLPPLTGSVLPPSSADTGISGTLEELPPEIREQIKSGDSLMLKAMIENGAVKINSLNGKISFSVNGQTVEIPVRLKLGQALSLPENGEVSVGLKAQGGGAAVRVQLGSINNQPPEKFLFQPAAAARTGYSAAVVSETGTSLPKTVLSPLRLEAFIENIGRELEIPSQVVKPLADAFRGSFAEFSLTSVLGGENKAAELKMPFENAAERIKLAVKNYFSAHTVDFPNTDGIRRLADMIKTELLPLKGHQLPGEAVVREGGGPLLFKTPLGDILPQTPLKLENGSIVLLDTQDFIERMSDNILRSMQLPGMRQVLAPSARQPKTEGLLDNLLKMLEPLRASGQNALAAAVIDRLPAGNDKLLSNLFSYMKAVNSHDVNAWLGSDLADKLSVTAEGREVAAKLGSLFAGARQDSIAWRIVEIPYYTGEFISKIRIAVRNLADEEEENKKTKREKYGTRFVVDTVFSRLGNFQFDGYSLEKDRRFDLVVRTEKNIGEDLIADIMRVFKTTLREMDYSGTIRVNVKEKFIKICDDKTGNELLKNGIYI